MKNFWNEMTFEDIDDAKNNDAIVIIPVGAVEQHGRHLPVGTDSILVYDIVKDLSMAVHNKQIIYTLPIWTGYSAYHLDFSGTITLDYKLLIDLVSSICVCISKHGFKRIILLNGHGGNINILRCICNELRAKYNIKPVTFNYWDIVASFIKEWRDSEIGGINHAGEMETSLMLYKEGETVKKEKFEKSIYDTKSKYLVKDMMVGNITSYPINVKEVRELGVLGDPTLASFEKGKSLYNEIIKGLADFIDEFQSWDIDNPKNL